MEASPYIIQLEGIGKSFAMRQRDVAALVDINLEVEPGELVAVRGPSGSGKTTLLMMVGGMLKPSRGTARLADQDLYAMSAGQRAAFRRKHVGFVFQTFHLVPYLSVLENVSLAEASTNRKADGAVQLLDRLGLSHRLDHRPSQLSAGEQQRTAIARAMLNQPSVILADEPGGNLDEENAQGVFEILKEYCDSGGAVIVATHGQLVDRFATRTIRLKAGRRVEEAITGGK